VRIGGDGGVAGCAVEGAVDAGVEGVRIDADVVAVGVLHGDVAVAGEAVGLRAEGWGSCEQQDHAGGEEGIAADASCCDCRISGFPVCREPQRSGGHKRKEGEPMRRSRYGLAGGGERVASSCKVITCSEKAGGMA
jgi:hypothetical protein